MSFNIAPASTLPIAHVVKDKPTRYYRRVSLHLTSPFLLDPSFQAYKPGHQDQDTYSSMLPKSFDDGARRLNIPCTSTHLMLIMGELLDQSFQTLFLLGTLVLRRIGTIGN